MQTWFVLHMDSFHVIFPSFHLFLSLFFSMVFLYLHSSENFLERVVSVSLAAFSFSSMSDHQQTHSQHFILRSPCAHPRSLLASPATRSFWCGRWCLTERFYTCVTPVCGVPAFSSLGSRMSRPFVLTWGFV